MLFRDFWMRWINHRAYLVHIFNPVMSQMTTTNKSMHRAFCEITSLFVLLPILLFQICYIIYFSTLVESRGDPRAYSRCRIRNINVPEGNTLIVAHFVCFGLLRLSCAPARIRVDVFYVFL